MCVDQQTSLPPRCLPHASADAWEERLTGMGFSSRQGQPASSPPFQRWVLERNPRLSPGGTTARQPER